MHIILRLRDAISPEKKNTRLGWVVTAASIVDSRLQDTHATQATKPSSQTAIASSAIIVRSESPCLSPPFLSGAKHFEASCLSTRKLVAQAAVAESLQIPCCSPLKITGKDANICIQPERAHTGVSHRIFQTSTQDALLPFASRSMLDALFTMVH